jgi:hypothetical protein
VLLLDVHSFSSCKTKKGELLYSEFVVSQGDRVRKWNIGGITVLAIFIYWDVESLLHLFVFQTDNLGSAFFPSEPDELWMRLLTILGIIVIGYLISRLNQARREVKNMVGLIPICVSCRKKIRTETGEWKDVEEFTSKLDKVKLTDGLCPDCSRSIIGKR